MRRPTRGVHLRVAPHVPDTKAPFRVIRHIRPESDHYIDKSFGWSSENGLFKMRKEIDKGPLECAPTYPMLRV